MARLELMALVLTTYATAFIQFGHSGYFADEFVQKYWVAAAAGKPIVFSETDAAGTGTPSWFGVFRLPLRWIIVSGIPVILALAALPALEAVGICMLGTVHAEGTCVASRHLKSKRDISARVSNLLVDIKKTLDLKRGTLFPLMQAFVANPNDETWNEVRKSANALHEHVEKSLDEITNYDAHLVKSKATGDIILITSDGRVTIDKRYWEAFSGARKMFEGRDAIFSQMMKQETAPDPNSVQQWFDKLTEMHKTLADMLQDLINLLDRA